MGAPTSAAVSGPGSPTITAQSASKRKGDPNKHLKNAKQRNEPVRVEPEDGVRYEFAYGGWSVILRIPNRTKTMPRESRNNGRANRYSKASTRVSILSSGAMSVRRCLRVNCGSAAACPYLLFGPLLVIIRKARVVPSRMSHSPLNFSDDPTT